MRFGLPVLIAASALAGAPARAVAVGPSLDIQLIPGAIGVTASGAGSLELSIGPDDADLTDRGPINSGELSWNRDLTPGATYVVSVSADSGPPTESTVVMPTDVVLYASNGGPSGRIMAQGGAVDGELYERNLAPAEACQTSHPTVSPDRRSLAYGYATRSMADGLCDDWHLVRQDVSTGERTELTSVLGDGARPGVQSPAWSPDGRHLAFVSCESGMPCSLQTIAAAGGEPHQFDRVKSPSSPVWAPDGTAVLIGETSFFVDPTNIGRSALVRVPIDDSAPTEIPGGSPGMYPALSPDGATLAYDQHTRDVPGPLVTLPRAGGTATVLPNQPDRSFSPVWSSDAKTLYFEQVTDNVHRVWSLPVDGSAAATELPVDDGWDADTPAIWSVDSTAPTVHLQVPHYVPGEPTFTFSATDPNSLVGGLTYTCSVDADAPSPCVSPFSPGALTRGAHSLTVTAIDPSDNVSDPATAPFTVDDLAPSRIGFETPGRIPTYDAYPLTAGSLAYHLSAVDLGSGVKSFQAHYETSIMGTAHGVYRDWFSLAADGTLHVAAGHRACFQVRALDKVGNLSKPDVPQCVIAPFDDRLLHVAAGWTRALSTVAVDGTVSVTTRKGATMTRTGFRGRRVELVVREGPEAGSVRISVGQHTRTLSLHHSVSRGYLAAEVDLGVTCSGTLTIVKSSIGGTVAIDAVAWH
jgi:hypothetical protein